MCLIIFGTLSIKGLNTTYHSVAPYYFKHRPHKMVKHTQTTRRLKADELFECVTILWRWHF